MIFFRRPASSLGISLLSFAAFLLLSFSAHGEVAFVPKPIDVLNREGSPTRQAIDLAHGIAFQNSSFEDQEISETIREALLELDRISYWLELNRPQGNFVGEATRNRSLMIAFPLLSVDTLAAMNVHQGHILENIQLKRRFSANLSTQLSGLRRNRAALEGSLGQDRLASNSAQLRNFEILTEKIDEVLKNYVVTIAAHDLTSETEQLLLQHLAGEHETTIEDAIPEVTNNEKWAFGTSTPAEILLMAELASRAYTDSLEAQNVLIAQSGSDGFKAVAYAFEDSMKLVVAFSGTDTNLLESPADMKADLELATDYFLSRQKIGGLATDEQLPLNGGNLDSQIIQANRFYLRSVSAFQEKFDVSPNDIFVVGHSLGGLLAQTTAIRNEVRARTFNAPGVPNLTARRHGIVVRSSVDIINIGRSSDLVFDFGIHIGQTVDIGPSGSFFPTDRLDKRLRTEHSMDGVLESWKGSPEGIWATDVNAEAIRAWHATLKEAPNLTPGASGAETNIAGEAREADGSNAIGDIGIDFQSQTPNLIQDAVSSSSIVEFGSLGEAGTGTSEPRTEAEATSTLTTNLAGLKVLGILTKLDGTGGEVLLNEDTGEVFLIGDTENLQSLSVEELRALSPTIADDVEARLEKANETTDEQDTTQNDTEDENEDSSEDDTETGSDDESGADDGEEGSDDEESSGSTTTDRPQPENIETCEIEACLNLMVKAVLAWEPYKLQQIVFDANGLTVCDRNPACDPQDPHVIEHRTVALALARWECDRDPACDPMPFMQETVSDGEGVRTGQIIASQISCSANPACDPPKAERSLPILESFFSIETSGVSFEGVAASSLVVPQPTSSGVVSDIALGIAPTGFEGFSGEFGNSPSDLDSNMAMSGGSGTSDFPCKKLQDKSVDDFNECRSRLCELTMTTLMTGNVRLQQSFVLDENRGPEFFETILSIGEVQQYLLYLGSLGERDQSIEAAKFVLSITKEVPLNRCVHRRVITEAKEIFADQANSRCKDAVSEVDGQRIVLETSEGFIVGTTGGFVAYFINEGLDKQDIYEALNFETLNSCIAEGLDELYDDL